MTTPVINKYAESKFKYRLNKRQQDIVNTARRDGWIFVTTASGR